MRSQIPEEKVKSASEINDSRYRENAKFQASVLVYLRFIIGMLGALLGALWMHFFLTVI